MNNEALSTRFRSLLQRYVKKLTIRGVKATGCCPFHEDRYPSFSANLDKAVFYCHACGKGGGVKKFAELIGEPWAVASLPRQERRRVAVSIRRRDAEEKARAILQQREDARLDEVFREYRDVSRDVALAEELLALFHRRADLEEEFADLAGKAALEYGAAIQRREYLQAQIDREVAK